MWFGTQDGLNKYDGYQNIVYKHVANKPWTLPANSIKAICEDADRNIWVGSRTGGLSMFDRKKEKFLNFKHQPGNERSLCNDNINVIFKDRRSNIWIGTASGLNRFDKKTQTFRCYTHDPKKQESLSSANILSIFEDFKGQLWIGTDKGLNLFDGEKGTAERYGQKDNTGKDNSINAIVEDENNNLWLGTNAGLSLMDRRSGEFKHYFVEHDLFTKDGVNPVFCVVRTANNRFWLGTNTTLQLFDATKRSLVPVKDQTDGESRMPNDGVYALLEDNARTLWIGTTSQGVLKYDKNLTTFPSYSASLINRPSAKNIVRSVAEDQSGNLYLATDAGLAYFDRSDVSYTYFTHHPDKTNSLSSNYTTSVVTSKFTGEVWVGTYSSGLDCLDPKTGKFRNYTMGSGNGNLSSNSIDIVFEDSKGNIWIGTDDGGLNVLKPGTGEITKYKHDPSNVNSICDNTILAITESKSGEIWIGGYSAGISIFNPVSGKFRHLNTQNSKLNCNVISTFYEDTKGNMWIGTMEGGLNCYHQDSRRFTAYSEEHGFINNAINYINEDSTGRIWISTNQGITSLEQPGKSVRNYGYINGLNALEFNLGSGARLRSGEIIMGSINGFNVINVRSIAFNTHRPEVVMTGLELFNKPVLPGAQGAVLTHSLVMTDTVNLNYKQNILTLKFAALGFTVPEKNTYAYMLEGFDESWRFVGGQREATYTNLSPGTYTFRVKAANNDGVWGKKETLLIINIKPAFWMTWYFKLAVTLVLILLMYAFYRYRISFIRGINEKLERLVDKRTRRIASQTHRLQKLNMALQSQKEEVQAQSEELQSQAEELYTQSRQLNSKTASLEQLNKQLIEQQRAEKEARLKAEQAQQAADKANLAKSTFLATMSHEIRTPLNGVLGMASFLSQTQLDEEQQEYTSAIVTSGKALMSVINDVLDFSKIESGNLELDHHEFSVRKCIEEVNSIFSLNPSGRKVVLKYELDDHIPECVIADSHRLQQVLINLVGNALKFTNLGEVMVKVSSSEMDEGAIKLNFEVRDTGIGISEDQISNLFQPFNQLDSSINRKYGGTGLGLVICARLVELLGGKLSVHSRLGEGSNFVFWIVCKRATKAGKNPSAVKKAHSTPDAVPLLNENFRNLYPMEVLVAEDHIMNQRLILKALSNLGYRADLANNGLEVLDLMKEKNYDLVLMDIQMPQMDGLETTRRIRAEYGVAPLIMALTANAMNDDRVNCMDAGTDDYMSKPLDLTLLVKKIIELYDIMKERRQLEI